MQRRDFLKKTGLLLGTLPAAGALSNAGRHKTKSSVKFDPTDWASIRSQFPLTHSHIHMATFLLTSHPQPVAAAIQPHREGFDRDPVTYWEDHFMTAEANVRAAAGEYIEANPAHIALTDSTTMGLGLVYGALRLKPGQEILTTPHDHYATIKSLSLRAERTGSRIREVALYDDPADTSVDSVVSRMLDAITDSTRVLAVTWVHSSTGVKLPLSEMSAALKEVNASRDPDDRVLFCVDGVHGFGIEDVTMEELGCDFFIAGTHKWIFGPRGTGIIWGSEAGWDALEPIIPSFGPSVGVWLGMLPPDSPMVTPGSYHTPGGFHSFEHRWSLGEAFRFHMEIGKSRVQDRIHSLNRLAKEAMAEMDHIRLYTPVDPALSSGIICFDVEGHSPSGVVDHLHQNGIVGSSSPYPVSYPRIAPSLINNEEEVSRAVEAIAELG
jgi:selenocysteine lyase/cysteine desulfurase